MNKRKLRVMYRKPDFADKFVYGLIAIVILIFGMYIVKMIVQNSYANGYCKASQQVINGTLEKTCADLGGKEL